MTRERLILEIRDYFEKEISFSVLKLIHNSLKVLKIWLYFLFLFKKNHQTMSSFSQIGFPTWSINMTCFSSGFSEEEPVSVTFLIGNVTGKRQMHIPQDQIRLKITFMRRFQIWQGRINQDLGQSIVAKLAGKDKGLHFIDLLVHSLMVLVTNNGGCALYPKVTIYQSKKYDLAMSSAPKSS